MDQATVERFAKEIKPAIDALLKPHGYECEFSEIKLPGLDMASSKLLIKPIGTDLQLRKFMTYAHFYGCTEADYQREVQSDGHVFKIVDFNPKRPKYPVDAVRVSDGKRYYLNRDCLEQLKATPTAEKKQKGAAA
jgi:hypothetical protein